MLSNLVQSYACAYAPWALVDNMLTWRSRRSPKDLDSLYCMWALHTIITSDNEMMKTKLKIK